MQAAVPPLVIHSTPLNCPPPSHHHTMATAALLSCGGCGHTHTSLVSQDALWALGGLECTNAGQVFLLLKSSDLIQYDLQHVFRECEDDGRGCRHEDGPACQPHLVRHPVCCSPLSPANCCGSRVHGCGVPYLSPWELLRAARCCVGGATSTRPKSTGASLLGRPSLVRRMSCLHVLL